MRLNDDHFIALVVFLKSNEILTLEDQSNEQKNLLENIIKKLKYMNESQRIIELANIYDDTFPTILPCKLPYHDKINEIINNRHILQRKLYSNTRGNIKKTTKKEKRQSLKLSCKNYD